MNLLPVTNFENSYQVSDCGLVFSIPRVVIGADGTKYPFKGVQLSLALNTKLGYYMCNLYKNNQQTTKYVHRLVAEAFVSNPENKPEVNHIDGDKTNNHFSNLEWVTSSENSFHAVNSGLRVYTNRLTENEFLDCLHSVINGESYASLSQRVPYKVPFLSTKLRKIAKKYQLESLLDDSLALQRINRARTNGNKNR